MPSMSSVSQGMSFIHTSDMDTSSSAASSPTLSASRPLADATLEEHPLYHFHDGSLAFEIEGVKYRVHSSLLARHCGFASTWPQDLRNPVASDIARADLDSFLSMIYLATYEYPDMNLSAEKWTSVLRLAARWKSDGIRALAVRRLAADLSPLDKLLLCRKYDVPGWLAPACAALALRPAPLTMMEAEQLEKSDIVRVFLAREAVSKGGVAATEEAISAWITGFSSKSSDCPILSPIVATPSSTSHPSTTTTTEPAESPMDPSSMSQETVGREAEVSDKEDARPALDAKTPTGSNSSQKDDVPPSQEATPAHTSIQLPKKPSYASFAEAARPPTTLSAFAFPFRTISHPISSTSQPTTSFGTVLAMPSDITAPIAPIRTPEEMIADAVAAIHAQRYDEAFDSLTVDNLKSIASQVAPSLVTNPQRPGVFDAQRLQHLLRAIVRRVIANPGFMPRGTQFMGALSTRSSLKSVRFEVMLHDDMQSLSSRWATFRAGGQPAIDHGGIMVDLSTSDRLAYQAQMGHGRGFFRTLVRLGVLPATNKYVEMLVQSHPVLANP
ncbi:hypothetical protein PENSPDRAFT_747647 [Peniophora sp. CONT]|nr:hypothetical protein PENSPDRAFT_747647 [Peniophora sp. CONT]